MGEFMLYGINELKRLASSVNIKPDRCYYPDGGSNICIVDDSAEVPLIRFAPFEKYSWLNMGFSTRLGGVSKGYFASLNLGFNRGDARENVCETISVYVKQWMSVIKTLCCLTRYMIQK